MQEKSIPFNRSPRPHPFWSTNVRKKPASKSKTQTRDGVHGIRTDSPEKRLEKKKAP